MTCLLFEIRCKITVNFENGIIIMFFFAHTTQLFLTFFIYSSEDGNLCPTMQILCFLFGRLW